MIASQEHQRRGLSRVVLGLAAALTSGSALHAQGGAEFSTIAATGMRAPGTPEGVTFLAFNNFSFAAPPAIGPGGQVAFYATLQGDGVTSSNATGVWGGPLDVIGLLTRSGDPISGFETLRWSTPTGSPAVDAAGNVLYASNTLSLGLVLALVRTGEVTVPFFYRGIPVPGLPAGTTFDGPAANGMLSAGGYVLARGSIQGPGVNTTNNGVVVTGSLEGLEVLAREGDAAPGDFADVVFQDSFQSSCVNSDGFAIVRAGVSGPGVNADNRLGLWAGAPGDLRFVARAGHQVPGMTKGIVWRYTFAYTMFAMVGPRSFLFTAFIEGPGVTDANDQGVWRYDDGVITPFLSEGDVLPGTPAGAHVTSIVSLNGRGGRVAGYAGLEGGGYGFEFGNGLAVALGTIDAMRIISVQGGPAAGMEPGIEIAAYATNSRPVVNILGNCVYAATLRGPGVTELNDSVLYATDRRGRPFVLAREGAELEVSPGVSKVVRELTIHPSAGDDGYSACVDDSGTVVLHAGFDDGTSALFATELPADICPADWTIDHVVDSRDFFAFLTAFFGDDADFNHSGETNSQDFFDFLAAFFVGCG